ncbi:unnamed protein product [Darwinula stevensoni]|uniref:Uncharacterized protein n=1 Tax=Darwinula stevensoni TaxID=69355 RepID=A0A7R9A1Y8_9CRUS|nr:unnamed protein product [Darwinula stevensoni]CAG0878834.1 unnamed protein product [Darwinula stevensoni]
MIMIESSPCTCGVFIIPASSADEAEPPRATRVFRCPWETRNIRMDIPGSYLRLTPPFRHHLPCLSTSSHVRVRKRSPRSLLGAKRPVLVLNGERISGKLMDRSTICGSTYGLWDQPLL